MSTKILRSALYTLYLFILLSIFKICILILFIKNNTSEIDQLQLFVYSFIESYNMNKTSLIAVWNAFVEMLRHIEIETNIYKLTMKLILLCTNTIMFIIHKINTGYKMVATIVYNIIIIFCIGYLVHYNLSDRLFRAIAFVMWMKTRKPHYIEDGYDIWDKWWRKRVDKTILLLILIVMLQTLQTVELYSFRSHMWYISDITYLPTYKNFLPGFTLSGAETCVNLNYCYIISTLKWNMLNSML
jgi:hypothetical protein